MIGQRPKVKKKHWLKRPTAFSPPSHLPPPKKKMGQNINDSISHVWNFFFWKYYFSHIRHYFTHLHQCTSEFFFNFRFSSRKSQSQQKLAKKMSHFTIQFRRKNLTNLILRTSTHLTLQIICSRDTAKNLWLYKVSSKHVSFWC